MKNLNNKILIGVLAGLILVVAFAKLIRAPRLQRSLPETLVQIDTASADVIYLYSLIEPGMKLEFVKKDKQWTVINGQQQATTEQGSVSNLLGYFARMTPQKLISKKKDKWMQYGVGDSSTRVVVMKGNKTIADMRIGRTGFNQSPANQNNPYGMGGFGSSYTCIRIEGEDEVYAVEGFLANIFNRPFNDWRDKSFLRIKAEEVERLRFNYPDSGFVGERKNGKWMIGNKMADSVKIKEYLNALGFINAQEFADGFQPGRDADLSLVIEGKSGSLATVKSWKRDADFVLSTTRQPGIYFSSASSGLVNTMFVGRGYFGGSN